MIFNPGSSYWMIDEETYTMMEDLLDPEVLTSIMNGFELIDGIYYANWDEIDAEESQLLEGEGIVLGRFDYVKSTQSTSPI